MNPVQIRPGRPARAVGRLCLPALLLFAAGAAPAGVQPAGVEPAAVGASEAKTQAEVRFFDTQAKLDARAEASREDQPYLVDVGARIILPRRDVRPEFVADRAELYVQFTEPLTTEERGALTRSGIRFFEALGTKTYLARVRRDAWRSLQVHPKWRGAELVLPQDKLTRELYERSVGDHVIAPDGSWNVYIYFHQDVTLERALRVLDRRGVLVPAPDRFLIRQGLEIYVRPVVIDELILSEAVRGLRPISRPPTDDNVQAAMISNIDDLQAAPYSLSGAGINYGQSEGGSPETTHPDLAGRVTLIDGANTGDHATHVAGTMISSGVGNAAALGMGFAGQLFWYDNGGNLGTKFANAAMNEAVVAFNNSWSFSAGWEFDGTNWNNTGNTGDFGLYEGDCADVDAAAFLNRGISICKSAGNAGGECDPNPPGNCDGVAAADGNYDNIEIFSASKNIITVGNLSDDGVNISGSSSRGPADDNRIKPDLVANGGSLLSTCIGASYCNKGGTSMSTPTTVGAIGLLIERWRQLYGGDPGSDVIKALLVNTAMDLGRPGPDYTYGHGLVDALTAVQTIDVAPVRILTEAVGQGETDEFLVIVPAGAPELRVTLNWLDLPGVTDSTDPDITNDLDLTLVSPTNQVFFPFTGPGTNYTANATATAANRVDTVEFARIPTPAQGFWRVRVRGFGVPVGPQNYALVSSLPFWVPDQPNVTVSAALDFDELCEGEFQDKIVSIFNTGGAPLLVHSVSVTAGAPSFVLQPLPAQPVFIHPGSHVDFWVRFDPPGPGMFNGTLEVVTNDPDMPMVTVPMTGAGCPPPDIAISGSTDFGNVCAGEQSEKTIQICNVGVDDLNVGTVEFIAPCADFQIVNNIFPAWVPGGHCLPLTVRYTPQTSGDHMCTLRILSNDPDENPLLVIFTGSTPAVSLDILPPVGFPPTVIQSIGDCVSSQPLVITNTGACPIYIKDISIVPPGAHSGDFSLVNLSAQPSYLLPGETVGDGLLRIDFRPNQVERFVTGTLRVEYQTDVPMIGVATAVTFPLCGEGVLTGARVLVQHNGVPVANVQRLVLNRIQSFGPPLLFTPVEVRTNLPPQVVAASPPCPGFTFHHEWGGITNPIQLQPGDYLIQAEFLVNGQLQILKHIFHVDECTFLADIVME